MKLSYSISLCCITISMLLFSCSNEEYAPTPTKGNGITAEYLKPFAEEYKFENVVLTKTNASKYEHLRPITTPEELEVVLKHISSNFIIGHKTVETIDHDNSQAFMSPKRMKTRFEPNVSTDIWIWKTLDQGTVKVQLNSTIPSVTFSHFYGSISTFVSYSHHGGTASVTPSNRLNFGATGFTILKIVASNGVITYHQIPTTATGYYHLTTDASDIMTFG